MKIIISPAKKMRVDTDTYPVKAFPPLLEETQNIFDYMRGLSIQEAKALWKCNDKIAEENFERFQRMDLRKNLTPAIISYVGIQYQYMAPGVFSEKELDYIEKHLYILSGFYGALRPFDGVTPYRLEMQAKAQIGRRAEARQMRRYHETESLAACASKDLYEFWEDRIYRCVMEDNGDRTIINLASKEYSKCIEPYLMEKDTYITCIFGELSGGKVIQKGTQAKMARGEMVRYMAEHGEKGVEELKEFKRLGYCFAAEHSGDGMYVFLK